MCQNIATHRHVRDLDTKSKHKKLANGKNTYQKYLELHRSPPICHDYNYTVNIYVLNISVVNL